MKKSNISLNAVIVVILLLVVTVTLFAGQKKIENSIDNAGRIEACRLSIIKAEATKSIPIKGGTPKSTLECDKKDLNIKYNDIITDKQLDQEKFNLIISKSLLNAWRAVDKGQHDPYSVWEDSGTEFTTTCIRWDKVRYDRKLIEFFDGNYPTFSFNSLYTTNMPGRTTTYSSEMFGQSKIPDNLKGETVEIDDNSLILAKHYTGDLVEFWWIPGSYKYWLGKKCDTCSYAWSLDIVPSSKALSDEDIVINGKNFRICDR